MRRVFIVNRYFAPDESSTSQIATALARKLVAQGREVHVLTTDSTYDGSRLPAHENSAGIAIHRIFSPAGTRRNLVLRAADYAQLYRRFHQAGLRHFAAGDIVIAKTDPPLLSIPVERAARRTGARLVNWLQDLYPEVGVNLGVPFLKGPVGSGLSRLRDRSLAAAAANVVISEGMAEQVASRGVKREQIHVIHNWAEDELIRPQPLEGNRLRSDWGLGDAFVVGYSGNLGRAHEIETVLGAAHALRGNADIRFLFIGGGRFYDVLRERVRKAGLDKQFQFRPYQEQSTLGVSLSAPDVHLVSLRPEVEGCIFPSKLYGVAAAGRPIIGICAAQGDVARVVEGNGFGLVSPPGDGAALAQAILALRHDRELCAAMGQRGRQMIEERYSKALALDKWSSLLDGVEKQY